MACWSCAGRSAWGWGIGCRRTARAGWSGECSARARAQKARAALEAEVRERERYELEDEGVNHSAYEVTRLAGPLAPGGTCSVDDAPFAELAEVVLADADIGSTAYLLERVAFDPEGPFCTNNNGDPTEGRVPLALYATRERAEAHRRLCEELARELVSPFAFPPSNEGASPEAHSALTSLSYEGLREGVRRLGLEPPGSKGGSKAWREQHRSRFWSEAWLAWWDERVDSMTDAQRAGVWALLDRLLFHTVTEVRLDG